jgi:hypothetical protein
MFASVAPVSAKGFGLQRAHFYSPSHIGLYRAHHYRHADRHRYGHARGHHGRHYAYGYVFVPSADDYLMPLYAGPVCQKTEETVIVPSESGGERTIRITRC